MKAHVQLFLVFCGCLQISVLAGQHTRPNESGPWQFLQINTWTGNLVCQRNDLVIPSRGEISLDISFTYNSLKSNQDRGYGNGWSFRFGMWYSKTGNIVTIGREEGEEDAFTYSGGVYLPPVGVYDQLTEYTSGKYLLTTKYGIKYYFDDPSHMQLTKISDRNGNDILLSYSGGLLTTITDPSGRVLTFTWANGHLSQITDPNTSPTRQVTFQYDAAWNTTRVTRPLSNIYQYGYDTFGYMTSDTDPLSGLITITYDSNMAVAGISCSAVSYQKTFIYNSCNSTTTVSQVVSSVNRQTVYTFDLTGRVLSKKFPDNSLVSWTWDSQDNMATFTNENGSVTTYTYDSRGNTLTENDCNGNSMIYTYGTTHNFVTLRTDKNGHPTTYGYDGACNLTSVTDCFSNAQIYTYDSQGHILTSTDRNGKTTTYTYDTYGNRTGLTDPLSFTETYTYDLVGNNLTYTDKRGFVTTNTYDKLDRLTSTVDANSHTITFSYDANGNLTGRTNQNSISTTYSYDPLNRLIGKSTSGSSFSYTYDEAGNILTMTNPVGSVTTYAYNSRDRRTSTSDCLSNSESYIYNAAGSMTSFTDKNGNTTSYTYDCLGRLTITTDPGGSTESSTYDPEGNKTNFTDKNNHATTFTYDCLDRLTNIIYRLGYSEHYTYDPEGNTLSFTNKRGKVTSYIYNGMNRLTLLTDPLLATESYSYDGNGNRTVFTNKRGYNTTYAYDGLNRLISVTDAMSNIEYYTYDGVGNMLTKMDKRGHTTTYAYDVLERLTSKTDRLGHTESYGYDLAGSQTSFTDKNGNTTTYEYNCTGRETSIKDPLNHTESYSYDPEGRRVSMTEKNGAVTTWTYNCCRLASMTDPLLNTETYGYDPVGNRTVVTNRSGHATTYFYDDLNRNTRVTTPMGNQTNYTYDGNGNTTTRTDANLQVTNYIYDNRDKLITTSYPDATSITSFFDNNGNLTQTTNTGGAGDIINYTYDALDQLTSKVTNFGAFTKTMTYAHDANGNLTSLTTESGTISYGYDYEDRVDQITDQAGLVTTFQYDNAGNQTVTHYPNGINTFTTYDAMGNVIKVVTTDLTTPPSLKLVREPQNSTIPSDGPLYLTDYSVLEITQPVSGPGLTNHETVTIMIMNYGSIVLLMVTASYMINSGPPVVENISIPIPPMFTFIYTFIQTADLSIPGQAYNISACVTASGDENPLNNCVMSVVVNQSSPGIVFTTYNYEYDAMGNMTSKVEEEEGIHIAYGYSLRNELLWEHSLPSGYYYQYSYTPTEERAFEVKDGIPATYAYNNDGALIASGPVSYVPDNKGNRIYRIEAGVTTSYFWGYEDDIRNVDAGGTGYISYQYSASGAKLKQTLNGIVKYFLSDGREPIAEYTVSGSPSCFYNPGLMITQGGLTGYYYHDGFGSTTLQLDPMKGILARCEFDAFGNMTVSSGAWMNNLVCWGDLDYIPGITLYEEESTDFPGIRPVDPKTGQPLMTNAEIREAKEKAKEKAKAEKAKKEEEEKAKQADKEKHGKGDTASKGKENPKKEGAGGSGGSTTPEGMKADPEREETSKSGGSKKKGDEQQGPESKPKQEDKKKEEKKKKGEEKKEKPCPVGKTFETFVEATPVTIEVGDNTKKAKGNPAQEEAEKEAIKQHLAKARQMCETVGAIKCEGPCQKCSEVCKGEYVNMIPNVPLHPKNGRDKRNQAAMVVPQNKAKCKCVCK